MEGVGLISSEVFLSGQFFELFLTGAGEIYRSDRAAIFDVEGNKIERRARRIRRALRGTARGEAIFLSSPRPGVRHL